MAIAIIAALLIHVIWASRSYVHLSPEITYRVRAGCAIGSLILTTTLFCLIQSALHELHLPKKYLEVHSAERQVVKIASYPANSICYAEIQSLSGDRQ